jgi:hypothetical protein
LLRCHREVGAGSFNATGFLIGIFAIWLYAAIRPRHGPGPKTAVCAGASAVDALAGAWLYKEETLTAAGKA